MPFTWNLVQNFNVLKKSKVFNYLISLKIDFLSSDLKVTESSALWNNVAH